MLNPINCEARVTVLDGDRTALVVVAGEIDKVSSPMIAGQIDQALGPRPHEVVLDLTDVTFMDTGGLDLLDHLHHQGHLVEPVGGCPIVAFVLGYWVAAEPV